MNEQTNTQSSHPDHVPEDRVVHFNIYDIPGSDQDVQIAYRAFQQAGPEVFWTPANGGHWVITRASDIADVLNDTDRFSSRRITVPPLPEDAVQLQIPIEVDPPLHAEYRRPLMRALLPRHVNALAPKVREVTVELIEGFLERGECEFIEEFSSVLPLVVFLDLVDLPRSDRPVLREMAERSSRSSSNEVRISAFHELEEYLGRHIAQRRLDPGRDLLSDIVNVEVQGKRISENEAMGFATLVMFGGLDTVASMLGFHARFLADNPDHRRQIVERLDDTAFVQHAIEEMIRRHGVSNIARVVTRDTEFRGVFMKAGDMVLPPNLLYGLDERRVDDPLTVDFSRRFPIPHAAFGLTGPHACPGAMLARRELLIFLQEWLKRIPDFRVKQGTTPVLGTGMVNGVLELHLEWGRGS